MQKISIIVIFLVFCTHFCALGFVEDGTDELIIDAGNDTTICFGQKIEIQAKSNSTSVRYRWFPLEGLSNPNTENPLAAPSVTTTYFVTVTTTDERFTSIDSVKITVLPVPEIEADNIVLCAGESSKLMVRCNESNVKYSWFPPQGLDRTDIADPVVFAQKPMTYTVTVTNAQGCSSIKTVQVNIQERERIRGELVSQKLAVEPDEPSALTLQLWSRITPFTSFKARIRYDKTVFQFNPSSDTLLLGTISTWQIRAIEEGPGELVLMAEGTTPVQNLIAGFELNTFLARQRDKEIRLLLEEVNGHNISEGDSCRDVVTRSTEIALEDICAGAIRFVRLGENVTNLYDVFPNPVTSSVLNISYSIGIPGNVSLKIYDSRGTPVITPVDHFAGEGEYNVSIGHNELGAGLYTCVLTTGQGLFTKSFLLLK